MKPLTALEVAALKKPGTWRVSRNLYLQVTAAGTRSWLFRFALNGTSREMGLGSCELVTLAKARDKALACREMLLEGADPIEERRKERQARALAKARTVTFKECGAAYIAAHETGWRNPKHRQQWRNTLAAYAYPLLGALPVQAIDTALVVKVLGPIWTAKPETASRVRARVESILDWATVSEFRAGDNPARWKGHLDQLLPARAKVRAVKHHAALPYADLPGFMTKLRDRHGAAARCLEFTILTIARTGEAIGAQWPEFDFAAKLWRVPGDRMKAGKEHVVPLSDRAIEILTNLPRTDDFVFEGARAGRPLSNTSMLMLMRRMGRGDLTTHGFRSTFRDWAAERTSYPRDVAEMALAHTIGDKVEAAYRRGDLLAKRRRLMRDWARYCSSPPATANVVELRPGAA